MISLDNLKTTLNAIKCLLNDYMKNKDVPTKLPNPKPLNFTGAVKRSYDGSKALTVEIPYSVQSDWNQNDSTELNYIKNRPFYTGNPVETVLVEESTVSFADAGGLYIAEFPSTFEATVGDTYKVYWDGSAYECTCAVAQDHPALGNLSIAGAGSDTGEPFLMRVNNGRGIAFYTADTSASHTISISGFIAQNVQIPDKYISDTFRDVIIAGDPLTWSADDWTKYYDLFQGGKLLKINIYLGSAFEGYVLAMFYKASPRTRQISVITSTGGFYKLSSNSTTNELYWAPVFNLDKLYFGYLQTGSDPSTFNREEYKRLEISDGGLTFTTKTSAENLVKRKVVLEGDNISAFTNDAGYLTSHQDISDKQDKLIAGENITIAADGKTISATGGGSDFETVESQLVDIPSKLSQLTNDAGYLTLNTLPKYDGSVT